MGRQLTRQLTEFMVKDKLESYGLDVSKLDEDYGIVDLEVRNPGKSSKVVRLQVKGCNPDKSENLRWFQLRVSKKEIEQARDNGIPEAELEEATWHKKVLAVDFFMLVAVKVDEIWVMDQSETFELIRLNEKKYHSRPDNIFVYEKPVKYKQKEMNLDSGESAKRLASCKNNFSPLLQQLGIRINQNSKEGGQQKDENDTAGGGYGVPVIDGTSSRYYASGSSDSLNTDDEMRKDMQFYIQECLRTKIIDWRANCQDGRIHTQGEFVLNTDYLEQVWRKNIGHWKESAVRGLPEAQLLFALCVAVDLEHEEDTDTAMEYFHKSAEQGYPPAQAVLGFIYQSGKIIPKDQTEAMEWYKRAARNKDIVGQFLLGYCYYQGSGVPCDMAEAAKWFYKSAQGGNSTAQSMLGLCYYGGHGVQQDACTAATWFHKAAQKGDGLAQSALGLCYANGHGVPRDMAEAIKWSLEAAQKGDELSQSRLGYCYLEGDGVKQDCKEAYKWYLMAAKQGQADAQYAIACLYQAGFGVEKDTKEAMKWLRKSANQGFKEAQKILEKKEKGIFGGCFLSTAVCTTLGKSDNCYELAILRQLRDTYMQRTPGRRSEVERYYKIAPRIVNSVEKSDDPTAVWQGLAEDHILPIIAIAQKGDFPMAHRLYRCMVLEMERKWL